MSVTHNTPSQQAEEASLRCPVDHNSFASRKTASSEEASWPAIPVEQDAQGVWHVYGFEEARAILRNGSATKQAGFNADLITGIPGTVNKPILYLEGKAHQQQRKQTARFFAPKTVSSSYRQFMEELADRLVDRLKRKKYADLSQLSLALAVQVAARVVGVTSSRFPGIDKRLDAFFRPDNHVRHRLPLPDWKPLTAARRLFHQRHILAFYWLDVRPAIRARKRQPQEDVISYLLSHDYSDTEILTECVTYAAAGMVTTREFICVAAWHFLEHPALRARYLAASEEERQEILHETLRLEPVVFNLFRRATVDIPLESQGKQIIIPAGNLINIHVDATNMDETIVGEEPQLLCPGRVLHGDRVPSMVMSFGDGPHRCPGAYIAIQETDIFLQRLLALDTLRIERPPILGWNELTTGYEIRDFRIAID